MCVGLAITTIAIGLFLINIHVQCLFIFGVFFERFLNIRTFVYIIMSISADVGSEYMKKLHYLGKKMKDAASTKIWFGGKSYVFHHFSKMHLIAVYTLPN